MDRRRSLSHASKSASNDAAMSHVTMTSPGHVMTTPPCGRGETELITGKHTQKQHNNRLGLSVDDIAMPKTMGSAAAAPTPFRLGNFTSVGAIP